MIERIIGLQGFILGKEFAIPLWEIMAFASFISFCLLFGKHRLGLVIAYFLVFCWGFVINYNNFFDMLHSTSGGLSLYVLSGVLMLIMTVVGLFIGQKDS